MVNSDLKRINLEEYTLFIWYSVFNEMLARNSYLKQIN